MASSINELYNSVKIGTHNRSNQLNQINTGRPGMSISYSNKSGADVIQFGQEENRMPEGKRLGFDGADQMHVGRGYEDVAFNKPQTTEVNAADNEKPFTTKFGSNPTDMHSDTLLYKDPVSGMQMNVKEAVRLGLVRKGPHGYETVIKA